MMKRCNSKDCCILQRVDENDFPLLQCSTSTKRPFPGKNAHRNQDHGHFVEKNRENKGSNVKIKALKGPKRHFKGSKGSSSKIKAFKGFKGSLGGLSMVLG